MGYVVCIGAVTFGKRVVLVLHVHDVAQVDICEMLARIMEYDF